jgi:hypothetical protein
MPRLVVRRFADGQKVLGQRLRRGRKGGKRLHGWSAVGADDRGVGMEYGVYPVWMLVKVCESTREPLDLLWSTR